MVSNEDAPTTGSIQVVLPRILLSSSAMIDLGRMDRLADLTGKFAIFSALGRSWDPPQARRWGRPVVKMAELLMNSAIVELGAYAHPRATPLLEAGTGPADLGRHAGQPGLFALLTS